MSDLLPFLPTFFLAFLAASLVMPKLIERLQAKSVMDIPNDRSMHKAPTPRGGGIALLLIIVPGFFLSLSGAGFPVGSMALVAALLLLGTVSWLDDRKGLGVGIRLATQLAAALLGLIALPETRILPDFIPQIAEQALIVITWIWAMNLTNFMDGIDGITGTETLCLVAGIALAFLLVGGLSPVNVALLALVGGATAGFLPHNWPPAKVFLGDVGSVPLGFLLAYFLLLLAPEKPVVALILPLYYLADSGITLGRRALRGEKIWQPHREHFYQRAAARFGHRVTVLWILAGNVGLLLAAFLFFNHPTIALTGAVIDVAILLFALHKLGPK